MRANDASKSTDLLAQAELCQRDLLRLAFSFQPEILKIVPFV